MTTATAPTKTPRRQEQTTKYYLCTKCVAGGAGLMPSSDLDCADHTVEVGVSHQQGHTTVDLRWANRDRYTADPNLLDLGTALSVLADHLQAEALARSERGES
jgi:hypothetical protein